MLCPYCSEEIQDAAVKCRFCKSMLKSGAPLPPDENPERDRELSQLAERAQTSMILGIIGLVCCQILCPIALFKAKGVNARLKELGEKENGQATAGFVLGIIGTIYLGLAVIGVMFYVLVFAAIIGGVAAGS